MKSLPLPESLGSIDSLIRASDDLKNKIIKLFVTMEENMKCEDDRLTIETIRKILEPHFEKTL